MRASNLFSRNIRGHIYEGFCCLRFKIR